MARRSRLGEHEERQKMIIIGINAYHGDSSACIIRDGQLIAAAEEERFRRVKHWAGFPSKSIEYCLHEAALALNDVDCLAINRDPKANILRKISFAFSNRPDMALLTNRIKKARDWATIEEQVDKLFPGQHFRGKVMHVEHHLAHLGSAFLVSPFNEAVALSVDGIGDFASAAWGLGVNGSIDVDERIYFPHSLGIFYQALTQYLGFPNYGDEYKVMGLAPYGRPLYMKEMHEIVNLLDDGTFRLNLEYFRHHKEKIEYEWDDGLPVPAMLFTKKLEELLGPPRRKEDSVESKHKDIARSVQALYEEAFFRLLNALHERYRRDAIVLAGGCAMNSVANGKIYDKSPFRKLYVQSAAGDAGGAIGAAYVAWSKHSASASPRYAMQHAYWGPSFSNEYIEKLLDEHSAKLKEEGCSVNRIDSEDKLCNQAAGAVADGKVVGWFQGRMEWGPRALGNRSIVCDPRRADMKDILNSKIKRRESFRPFAPSILRRAVPEWFETDDDVPFMMQVFMIREEKRSSIPAVTHVDGTGRLQTVYADTNARYYKLIESFERLTGVPIVLNTSFNENEPVVCTPDEALACFLRTKMDVLVLENLYVTRNE